MNGTELNSGPLSERVIDLVRPWVRVGNRLDILTSSLSLFAFVEALSDISKLAQARLLLPPDDNYLNLLSTSADRGTRNDLHSRWLAKRCVDCIQEKIELRRARAAIPQVKVTTGLFFSCKYFRNQNCLRIANITGICDLRSFCEYAKISGLE